MSTAPDGWPAPRYPFLLWRCRGCGSDLPRSDDHPGFRLVRHVAPDGGLCTDRRLPPLIHNGAYDYDTR